jgi:hypothetical protein
MVHTNPEIETLNLILDFEFDQHSGSHKHVINIIMWFRDMGCYTCYRIVASSMDSTHCFQGSSSRWLYEGSLSPANAEFPEQSKLSAVRKYNVIRVVV